MISSDVTENSTIRVVLLVPKSFLDVRGQVGFKVYALAVLPF